ncbi:D-alanyl-D-alanine carboxypeptidase/D-alanyl-D-alanine-endopeptidase [bacterium]|nr:D-alanyl-D-alanine carboxypeptidase/D-alanyl-D-alanine-endopeptidase [bacterium]
MKKLLITLLALCAGVSVQAKTFSIEKSIQESNINKAGISISVRNVNSGKILYELNPHTPRIPASTLKAVTSTVALDTLGEDFNFTTSLYKTKDNELLLKLSGDPQFTKSDLNSLLETASEKNIVDPKAFYIDDYVMDSVIWGEGWQWDDDLNPLMPKFSSYNIDQNLLTAIVDPKTQGAPANIQLTTFYPVTFMNLVTTGKENDITFTRNNHISPDIINVSGVISSRQTQKIPVNSPKRYFLIKLEEAIIEHKIGYYGAFPQKKLPLSSLNLIEEIKRPINIALNDSLKNSSNLSAETLFKVAGGHFVKNTGAIKNSILMFNEYCKKNNLKNENIKIADGSGVSKNNLMTADFMTNFLVLQTKKENFEKYLNLYPTAGEGTLKNRMLYFKDIIFAKTGTLSDASAICGYIKTRDGNLVVFDIMIQDAKSSSSDKKATEEQIIRAIYNKY